MEIKIGGINFFGSDDGDDVEMSLGGISFNKPKDDVEGDGADTISLGGIRFVRSKDGVKKTSMGPAGITIEIGGDEFDEMLKKQEGKTEEEISSMYLNGISMRGQPGSVSNLQVIKSININMKKESKR